MGRAGRVAAAFPPRALLILGVALLAGCSPVYVFQSAAGQADLLLRRRSIEKAIADPRTPAALRSELLTAEGARAFAFDALGLKRTRDFSTYSPIDRSAVTYLVSGSQRLALKPYEWWFPLIGSFPYKGYFDKKRAFAERDRLERKGFDSFVGGVAAYHTPLPFADPLPTSALDQSTGAVAALVIHELTHGTVYFKDNTGFDEALAQWVGEQGAQRYLAERFGPDSGELAGYRKELADEAAADRVFDKLRTDLTAVYASSATAEAKLAARQPLFDAARDDLRKLGFDYKVMNNAVVSAHEVYHGNLPFEKLLDKLGGDFPRFIAELKTLDRRDPEADLRRRAENLAQR